jgi:hypothetical protein
LNPPDKKKDILTKRNFYEFEHVAENGVKIKAVPAYKWVLAGL